MFLKFIIVKIYYIIYVHYLFIYFQSQGKRNSFFPPLYVQFGLFLYQNAPTSLDIFKWVHMYYI